MNLPEGLTAADIEDLREELKAGCEFVPANHPAAKISAVLALVDMLAAQVPDDVGDPQL